MTGCRTHYFITLLVFLLRVSKANQINSHVWDLSGDLESRDNELISVSIKTEVGIVSLAQSNVKKLFVLFAQKLKYNNKSFQFYVKLPAGTIYVPSTSLQCLQPCHRLPGH